MATRRHSYVDPGTKTIMHDELKSFFNNHFVTVRYAPLYTPANIVQYMRILGINPENKTRLAVTYKLDLPRVSDSTNIKFVKDNNEWIDFMNTQYATREQADSILKKFEQPAFSNSNNKCGSSGCPIMGGRRTRKAKKPKRSHKSKKSTHGTRRV